MHYKIKPFYKKIALLLSLFQLFECPLTTIASNTIDYEENESVSITDEEPALPTISLDSTSLTLKKGETFELHATLSDSDSELSSFFSWESEDDSIVSVNDKGIVTANNIGTAMITVSFNDLIAQCSVTVTNPISQILFDESTISLPINERTQLTPHIFPDDNDELPSLSWESDNENILTVDDNGFVTGISAGTATVTVSSEYCTASCDVTIYIPIESISIINGVSELKLQQQLKLQATILPEDTTEDTSILWESSDNNIISIDDSGLITAKAPGIATISATTTTNLKDSISIVVSKETFKTGWIFKNGSWFFYDNTGSMQTGWLYLNKHVYYLYSDGRMATGWLKLDSKWYYFRSDGAMYTGWLINGSHKYYFKSNGEMQIGWIKIDNQWYYYDENGNIKTGWLNLEGNWYYLQSNGIMKTGWLKLGNSWYFLQSNGIMTTNWIKLGNFWYYMKSNGSMATGWFMIGNNWYYFQSNGSMKTGWLKLGNSWYFLQSNGIMATNWIKLGNFWYYMKSNGSMATGWLMIGNNWYYFQSDGSMKTGWLKLGNSWYFLQPNGIMVTGWVKLGTVWYYFNESGVMKKTSTSGPIIFSANPSLKIKKCTANVISQKDCSLSIETTRSSSIENKYSTFYLLILNSNATELIDSISIELSNGSTLNFSCKLSSDDNFKSISMNKYAIAVKSKDSYEIISDCQFIENPDSFASKEITFKDNYWGYYENYKITSKKGIQGVSDSYTENLRAQHVLLNVDIEDLVWTSSYPGYVPYTYKGKTYYFSDLQALKKTIYDLHGWGSSEGNAYGEKHTRNVTIVLLLSWKYDELSYLIHPDARTKGTASYYSLNMKDDTARKTYEALFCYLGEELGQMKERVNNWTLGNEVNSCNIWNYSGNMTFENYVTNYALAFQLLNQGIKRTAKSPRLFISLDHCWNTADAGYTGKEFLDYFAKYMDETAPCMQWNVNYHPYSQPLTRTDFWKDQSNTKNTVNTNYISMENIQILTDYLSHVERTYGKSSDSIRVIIGEIGFSGKGGNASDEKYQAAALGYGYYIAMFNKRIDSYIIRAYLDAPTETASGLYLGLRQANYTQTQKESYYVYQNLDTNSSLKVMNSYLNLIGISSWESAISGFDASKLPAKDF